MKTLKLTLFTAGLSIFLIGCGSASVKKDKVVFTKNYTGKTYSDAKSLWSSCQTRKKAVDGASWKQLMKFANTCAASKKWSDVEKLAYVIIEKEPESPWGLYYLSLVSESKGLTRKALWMVDMAIKKAPNSGTIHYQKARLLWQEKEYELAMVEMEKAIDFDPELTTAHLFLGQVKLRDQDFKSAKGHFEKVLKQESSNFDALLGAASSMNQMRDYKDAAPLYEKAISENPKALQPRFEVAYIYENHLKDPQNALKHYDWIHRRVSKGKIEKYLGDNISQKITTLKKKIVDEEKAQRKISSQTPKNKAVK
tara:strand:- start:28949 stop:29878 length:930 start_codon:yes stop_codon:yes gene_type:complete